MPRPQSAKNGTGSKLLAFDLKRGTPKSEVVQQAKKDGRLVHFASLVGFCHLEHSEREKHLQKVQGRVVFREDKDDSVPKSFLEDPPITSSSGCEPQKQDCRDRSSGRICMDKYMSVNIRRQSMNHETGVSPRKRWKGPRRTTKRNSCGPLIGFEGPLNSDP